MEEVMAYIDGNGNMRDGSPEPYDMSNGQNTFDCEDPEPTWRMRGGREIRIRDMGDGHLLNTDRAIRAGTVKVIEMQASMIFGEITRRGLSPRPDFSCPEEAQATAAVSCLYTYWPRLDRGDRDRCSAYLNEMCSGVDEMVFDPDDDIVWRVVTAIRIFFEDREGLDDAAKTRVDQALETWLERQWDGG